MTIDRFQGEYEWLSNFHECEIDHLGLVFPTTEHAYAASKRIDDVDFHKQILALKFPGQAKRFGRSVKITTPNWDLKTKFIVMYNINLKKFSRHENLKAKLLATGDEELIEGNTWGDRCWGVCNGVGDNHLGKTLMAIREYIRNFEA